jgi:hypothetical protein
MLGMEAPGKSRCTRNAGGPTGRPPGACGHNHTTGPGATDALLDRAADDMMLMAWFRSLAAPCFRNRPMVIRLPTLSKQPWLPHLRPTPPAAAAAR